MAFVNEAIPEEQKNEFPFPVYTARDGSKPTLYKWTIDRERDAYLVVTNVKGGGYEGTAVTEHFVLSWKGELIRFQCNPQSSGNTAVGQMLSMRIHHLMIPPALQNHKEEVLQLIREILDAKDWPYRRSAYVEVNVQFDSSLSC